MDLGSIRKKEIFLKTQRCTIYAVIFLAFGEIAPPTKNLSHYLVALTFLIVFKLIIDYSTTVPE